ncbi:MAG TPA: hypothetical protein VG474_15100 [Solirubrobacteraceae bacterium]|nr:hypothetical protein [Solirubrobacteraceae bacterium]
MQLSSVDSGDIVLVDKKGRVFHAVVEAIDGQQLKVAPIERHNTWRTATAKEIIGIWRASKATRTRRGDPGRNDTSSDEQDAPIPA